MALQKTVTTAAGLTATNAYHRVEGLRFATKQEVSFLVRSYASTDLPFFAEAVHACTYDIAGDNPIKQAYEHLKTLPEFADATDV